MKTTKKAVALLLLLALCMTSFVACGGSDESESDDGVVSCLSGTYLNSGNSNLMDWYLTFTKDGSIKITEYWDGAGTMSKTGRYEINGDKIVVSGIGYTLGCPGIAQDGEYSFSKQGKTLIINETEWTPSNKKLPEEEKL